MIAEAKQDRVQILLSYTKDHRRHLDEQKEIACRALSGLVSDAIKKAHGKVTKTVPLDDKAADLMIEGIISSEEEYRKLFKKYLSEINKTVGAEKVYVFAG